MKNKRLPKYVELANGRYVYRPYIKKHERGLLRTDSKGYIAPPIRLAGSDATEAEVYRQYLIAVDSISEQKDSDRGTVNWILDQYIISRKFKELAKSSQKNTRPLMKIRDYVIGETNGRPTTLGEMKAGRLTPPMIRRIADKRVEEFIARGLKGLSHVNHEIHLLGRVFNWALQNYDDIGLTVNPCANFEAFKAPPRTRVVKDWEYEHQAKLAVTVRDYLPVVFELAYLGAARGIEILDLKFEDCNDDGILYRRRKGSNSNRVLWSPRLRAAYDAAKALHAKRKVSGVYLIPSMNGSQMKKSALERGMDDLRRLMKERDELKVFWTLHMLKHKGATDGEDKDLTGHKSATMKAIYDHSEKTVKPSR